MTDPRLVIIPGDKISTPRFGNNQSDRNMEEHISKLRPQFAGQPEVCHEIIGYVVRIRRNNNQDDVIKFWSLLTLYKDAILSNLNTRWLISICDTIVDTGNDVDSAAATVLVTFTKTLRMSDACIDMVADKTLNNDTVRSYKTFSSTRSDAWGGINFVTGGDTTRNLFKRMNKTITKSEIVSDIWSHLLPQIQNNSHIIKTISAQWPNQKSFYK